MIKRSLILIIFILVASNASAYTYCTETGGGGTWLICEDWDSGTPPADPWPTVHGVTWQGWTPATYGDCPGDGDITTTYAHSSPKSLMQYKPSGCEDSTNIETTFTQQHKIYVRFYLYVTSDITHANPASCHMIFVESGSLADATLDIRNCDYQYPSGNYVGCDSGYYLSLHTYSPEVFFSNNTGAPDFNLGNSANQNRWVLVEFMIDAVNDLGSLWIDEVQYVNNAPIAWSFSGTWMDWIEIAGYTYAGGGGAIHWYYDDFVVSPTYIGPRGCSIDADCNDSNVCTTDTCPAGECVFTNNTDACDDGLYCNTGEACSGGSCVGGSARNCADADACTTDSCNETTNACDNTYGAATVDVSSADTTCTEDGGTCVATFDCDETAGTTGCCTSLSVDYTLSGTASGGGIDYSAGDASPVAITDAATPKTVTFTPIDDAIYEGGAGTYESINVSVTAGTNYSQGIPAQVNLTLEDNDSEPATPPATPDIVGLHMLGAMNVLALQGDSDKTYLDGYAARVTWKGGTGGWAGGLDSGTVDDTPIPDWTYIDNLFINAAAQMNNHNVMLYVWTAEPPPHVLVHSAALGVDVDTYIPYVSNSLRTCPIPWDAAALDDLEVFWAALAAHTVGGTAVKDRPELIGIRADFLGLKGIRDLSDPAVPGYPILMHDANYNRTLFIAGVLTSLHACADVFPGIPIVFEIHSMYDSTGRVDTAIIDAVATEFDGSPNPILGVYAENWNIAAPSTAGQPGINLLHARSHGSNVGFQALAAFASQSDMEAALQFALSSYGCKFFEIYRANTEAYPDALEKWQNVMNGTNVPGGCTIISTGTGKQTMSPMGTGREDIFYPILE